MEILLQCKNRVIQRLFSQHCKQKMASLIRRLPGTVWSDKGFPPSMPNQQGTITYVMEMIFHVKANLEDLISSHQIF